MDEETLGYYRRCPHQRLTLSEEMGELALRYTAQGCRVLEVACGSGWLARQLAGAGRTVMTCDLTLPEAGLGEAVFVEAAFPIGEEHALWSQEPFSALCCVAMLMHLGDSDLLRTLRQFRELVRPGGHLIVSTCTGGRELDENGHDERGVYYAERPAGDYELVLERLGFQTVERRLGLPDGLGREGIRWDVWVGVNNGAVQGRGVDHAVSLIHQDAKTSTYKLALLRALVDLAQDQPHVARWQEDGRVSVPYASVVDLWIRYYWPLLRSGVPQIQGGRRLGFASVWEEAGNFAYADEFLAQGEDKARELRREVRKCLCKGPLVFSKGVEDGPLFQRASDDEHFLVPGVLWKELSLLGHWIRDSLLLEWARVSASFSEERPEARGARLAEYLAVLMGEEMPERCTGPAQGLYGQVADLRCVWTGKQLLRDLHVDHLIPYSQWHTNAWWNLQPTSRAANLSKSDRIPTYALLRASEERLRFYWDMVMRAEEDAFVFEIRRDFLGSGPLDNWQGLLFDAMCERMERMAEQRGLARWNGIG